MYPWGLSKLADVIARSLLIIFECDCSWRLEESRFHPYTQEGQERNIGLSAHLIPWEENSIRIQKKIWKPFPNTWMTRWLGIAKINLQRGNHAWPISLSSTVKWLSWWKRGDQRILFTSTLVDFDLVPCHHRQAEKIWVR